MEFSGRGTLLKYPSYIQRQLNYFEGLRLQPNLNDYEKLRQEYKSKIGAIFAFTINLNKGAIIYRARPMKKQSLNSAFDINENDFFNNIKELGINSPERTKEFGRANRIGAPVLYTSLHPDTAIHEIAQWERIQYKITERMFTRLDALNKELIEEGVDLSKPLTSEYANRRENAIQADFYKNMVVSEWEVQEPLKLAYFFDDSLIPKEISEIITEEKIRADENYLKDTPYYESFKLIERFFAKQFTKTNIESQADYMLTALCTEWVCDYAKTIVGDKIISNDGILYASVAEGYQGVNCVLTSEAVSAGKVKFVGARWHMVSNPRDRFHGVFNKAEIVSEETGELKWKTPGENPENHSNPE